jgi:hypothetical protein
MPWTMGAGCDLFATREPPPIDEGTEGIWEPPTSPQIVVENLERAFEAGSSSDYIRALTEDFVFRPDDADVVQIDLERPGEGRFDNWDREVERETALAIHQSADSLDLGLQLFEEVVTATGRLIKYRYDLVLTQPSGATTYAGEGWFQVRQEANGEWLIFDWEDVANSPTADSWGLLKGRTRPTGGAGPP